MNAVGWGHTIKSASHEESSLGSAGVQRVDEFLSKLRWTVVIGKGDLARGLALGDDLWRERLVSRTGNLGCQNW